jgi:hypothetical protein
MTLADVLGAPATFDDVVRTVGSVALLAVPLTLLAERLAANAAGSVAVT